METKICVYILLCRDGTLYTGWTNNLAQRLDRHNSGRGAKYTRARRPVELVYVEYLEDKSSALKREYQIKQMTRVQKDELLAQSSAKTLIEQ